MSERCIPLKNRTMSEVLNPQPEVSAVIQRLWDWIDRADVASQSGAPKLLFETVEGEPMFPEDEEDQWWLTDVSRRVAQEEKVEGDEDGPASEELEPEQRECSDSAGSEPEGAASARRHAPFVAWRRS